MNIRAHALVVLVTLSCLLFIVRLLRRRQLRAKYAMLWASLGIAIAILAAFPPILDRVSMWLGIFYAPATLFLGATVLLFLIAVHFSWELSRQEDRIRSLAEEVALLRLEVEDTRRGSRVP